MQAAISLIHALRLHVHMLVVSPHAIPLSPSPSSPLSFFQASAAILLHALRAASCPVGPAPQRMAYLFGEVLASRLAGDGMERYLKDVPSDPKTLERALAHNVARIPHAFYFGSSAVLSVIHALASAQRSTVVPTLSLATGLPAVPVSKEHLHVIDVGMEFSFLWLPQLFHHLAARPQGPPHSLRVTILDVCPAALASVAESRRMQAMDLKEKLALKAVTAGVERFECDVVFSFADDLIQTLAGLRFSEERERKRRERGVGVGGERGRGDTRWAVRGEGAAKRANLGPLKQNNSRCDGGAGRTVDVLAVCSILKLHELSDLAGSGPSTRDCMLAVRWGPSPGRGRRKGPQRGSSAPWQSRAYL